MSWFGSRAHSTALAPSAFRRVTLLPEALPPHGLISHLATAGLRWQAHVCRGGTPKAPGAICSQGARLTPPAAPHGALRMARSVRRAPSGRGLTRDAHSALATPQASRMLWHSITFRCVQPPSVSACDTAWRISAWRHHMTLRLMCNPKRMSTHARAHALARGTYTKHARVWRAHTRDVVLLWNGLRMLVGADPKMQ